MTVSIFLYIATSPRELPSYTVNSHHNTEKLPSYTLSTLYIPGMNTLILSIYMCIPSYDGICKYIPSYDGICEYMRVQNILTKCHNFGIRTVNLMHTARLSRPLDHEC